MGDDAGDSSLVISHSQIHPDWNPPALASPDAGEFNPPLTRIPVLSSGERRPGFHKRSTRKDQFLKTRNIHSSQGGFTVIELLVAMALIVLLMSSLSQAFSEGARTFRHLKALGDLDERLGPDCMALAENIAVTNQRTRELIENGLRTGTVNREEAGALRKQYEAICAEALDLELRLRDVQSKIHNPGAQRVLERSLNELERLKSSAATMVRLLGLF
jgi:prepilin-type N-terminal cleavage/methylation domain-containing protein